mmetsp:Transcript_33193/g.46380  ORF Transcript_33193/g.46380 Transcript_33193/m.46380 type:complete len:293 (+) Transcript_33193:5202-6080(+)
MPLRGLPQADVVLLRRHRLLHLDPARGVGAVRLLLPARPHRCPQPVAPQVVHRHLHRRLLDRNDGDTAHAADHLLDRAGARQLEGDLQGAVHAHLRGPAVLHVPHGDQGALLRPHHSVGGGQVPAHRARLRRGPYQVRRAVPVLLALALPRRRGDGAAADSVRDLRSARQALLGGDLVRVGDRALLALGAHMAEPDDLRLGAGGERHQGLHEVDGKARGRERPLLEDVVGGGEQLRGPPALLQQDALRDPLAAALGERALHLLVLGRRHDEPHGVGLCRLHGDDRRLLLSRQ